MFCYKNKIKLSIKVDSAKLKFNDVGDHILIEEVNRIDLGDISTLSSALNLKSKGRRNEKILTRIKVD